jgi:hypothetical protein
LDSWGSEQAAALTTADSAVNSGVVGGHVTADVLVNVQGAGESVGEGGPLDGCSVFCCSCYIAAYYIFYIETHYSMLLRLLNQSSCVLESCIMHGMSSTVQLHAQSLACLSLSVTCIVPADLSNISAATPAINDMPVTLN